MDSTSTIPSQSYAEAFENPVRNALEYYTVTTPILIETFMRMIFVTHREVYHTCIPRCDAFCAHRNFRSRYRRIRHVLPVRLQHCSHISDSDDLDAHVDDVGCPACPSI